MLTGSGLLGAERSRSANRLEPAEMTTPLGLRANTAWRRHRALSCDARRSYGPHPVLARHVIAGTLEVGWAVLVARSSLQSPRNLEISGGSEASLVAFGTKRKNTS